MSAPEEDGAVGATLALSPAPADVKSAPLIGITTYPRDAEGRFHLPADYVDAVRRAGGVPVMLPPGEAAVDELIARLDGFVLSGGGDVDPVRYGGDAAHPTIERVDAERDTFELALARAVVEREVPALTICRGCQVLNVARGGTLHQHLPGHRQTEPATATTHTVQIEPGSRLADVAGAGRLRVNSFHHQAVDVLGHGLRAVAHSADGIVEAIEASGPRLVLAVQWHAEGLTAQPRHRALFAELVAASAAPVPRLRRAA